MSARVLIYVQHLLGIGHVRRMVLVANALNDAGAQVLFVTGGLPIPHIRPDPGVQIRQLPPISAADVAFSGLVDDQGEPVDDWLKQQRRDLLVQSAQDFEPDTVLIEMFPFGRRQMRFELLPLLDRVITMSPRPAIVCSVRDIVNVRPHRADETLSWLNSYFDRVIVHSDPDLFRLEESVPDLHRFNGAVDYSGYITPKSPPGTMGAGIGDLDTGNGPDIPEKQVLVSAGGGAVGDRLFEKIVHIAPRLPNQFWRFRHGNGTLPSTLAHWRRQAPLARFEPVAADFLTLLARSELSVSQAGYNTVCDLFATGCRSVLIPFAGGSETEQTRRAERLKARGFKVSSEKSTPDQLVTDIEQALRAPPPDTADLRLDGAATTARILMHAANG